MTSTFASWPVRVLAALAIVVVLGLVGMFGYRLWYNSINFVSTDNAQVTAALVQVGSINAGRIFSMNVDVGSPVSQGQVIAIVDIPTLISKSETTDTSKLGFRDVRDQLGRRRSASVWCGGGPLGQGGRHCACRATHSNPDGSKADMGDGQHR